METLGEIMVYTAYKSARMYLQQHRMVADNEALMKTVKAQCKTVLPEAITDARSAYDRGMNQIGDKTFLASFSLAGIEAAKECGRTL